MKAVASALPAFIGSILGVCIYVHYLAVWSGGGLIIVGTILALTGRSLLSTRPIVAARLVTFWILVGIGLMGYASCFLLWLALHVGQFLPKSDAASLKELGGAVSGAATTFLGVVLTKDFEDGKGFFWPGAFFRQCIQRIYGRPPLEPERTSAAFDAVWNDRLSGGTSGWGYKARVERAKILNQHPISVKATMPTARTRDKQTATFLAHMVWLLGAFLVVLSFKVWGAITTFLPISLLFLSDLSYSECLSASLWILIIPLAALHITMHYYQLYTVDRERFPGQLGPYKIPKQLRWVRVILFITLVFGPSFSYGYFVGRMFDHLAIVWYADEGLPDPRVAPSSKKGFRLVTDWGYHSDGTFGGPFESGWRWWAWQDYRSSYGTIDSNGKRTAKIPHAGVYPGLVPTTYSIVTWGLILSLSFLSWRRLPGDAA